MRAYARSIPYTFRMRYLGVDYGSGKIGLALSDDAGVMGFPHTIIANTPRLLDELHALIKKEHVGAVVIGESRTLAGIPVFFESELFTSAEARRTQVRAKKSRAPRSREAVDASAAALILTSYLSRTNHG